MESPDSAVQDEMFLAAARGLADFVTPEQIKEGKLYPEAKDLRKVAATVGGVPSSTLLPAVSLLNSAHLGSAL